MEKKDSKKKVQGNKQNDETIMYQPIKKPKTKKTKTPKEKQQKKKHPKLKMFLKVMLVMMILTAVIVRRSNSSNTLSLFLWRLGIRRRKNKNRL